MRKKLVATAAIPGAVVLAFFLGAPFVRDTGPPGGFVDPGKEPPREIVDTVRKGETVSTIFEKHRLDIGELFRMREASAGIHRLRDISVGMPHTITLDPDNNVLSLAYHINDGEILRIVRSEPGYLAEKVAIEYERRVGSLGGVIQSNLVSSLPEGGSSALLAIELSDIFSWDVDFNTDFRKGDTFLNPLTVNLPRGGTIPPNRMPDFRGVAEEFARSLAEISPALHARANPRAIP